MTSFIELAARGRTSWWLYPLAVAMALIVWLVFFGVLFLGLEMAHLVSPPPLARN